MRAVMDAIIMKHKQEIPAGIIEGQKHRSKIAVNTCVDLYNENTRSISIARLLSKYWSLRTSSTLHDLKYFFSFDSDLLYFKEIHLPGHIGEIFKRKGGHNKQEYRESKSE
jgi:hypothetical protein